MHYAKHINAKLVRLVAKYALIIYLLDCVWYNVDLSINNLNLHSKHTVPKLNYSDDLDHNMSL